MTRSVLILKVRLLILWFFIHSVCNIGIWCLIIAETILLQIGKLVMSKRAIKPQTNTLHLELLNKRPKIWPIY